MKKLAWLLGTALSLCILPGCTSFEEIKAAADAGDPNMLYELGVRYYDGTGTPQDLDAAYECFKKAADKGNAAGAYRYAFEAIRRKDVSEPELFLKRIQQIFYIQNPQGDNKKAVRAIKSDYPQLCIGFAKNLRSADAEAQLVDFRKQAKVCFNRECLSLSSKKIDRYLRELESVRTQKEAIEIKRKKIEEAKRREENECACAWWTRMEKNIRDNNRLQAEFREKLKREIQRREGESLDQWESRTRKKLAIPSGFVSTRNLEVYYSSQRCVRIIKEAKESFDKDFREAYCSDVEKKIHRESGESFIQWNARVKKVFEDAFERGYKYTLSNVVSAFYEEFRAELKPELSRKSGESLVQWKSRVEKTFTALKKNEKWRNRFSGEEIFFEREFEKESLQEKLREYKLRAEKMLSDPTFKYPYADRFAGIELHDGYLSGLSCKWLSVYKYGNSEDPDRISQKMYATLSYDDIEFYFDERHGTLHSVSFDIDGSQESVEKKIAEYKKKFPGLKHTRTTQQDGKNFSKQGVYMKVKISIISDILESERIKIVIISKKPDYISVRISHIYDQELSDLQKKELITRLENQIRQGCIKNAEVTITDKKMKNYFESLKK